MDDEQRQAVDRLTRWVLTDARPLRIATHALPGPDGRPGCEQWHAECLALEVRRAVRLSVEREGR